MKVKPFDKFELIKFDAGGGYAPAFPNDGFIDCYSLNKNGCIIKSAIYDDYFYLDRLQIKQNLSLYKKDILIDIHDLYKAVERVDKLFKTLRHKIFYRLIQYVENKNCDFCCLVWSDPELYQYDNRSSGKYDLTVWADYSVCALVKG